MQFLTSLFGGSDNTIVTAALALGIVLVLIVLGLWLLKLLSRAAGNAGRGRNRRLGVIDNLPVDPKRQLIIIRRDNVEHLILTGGPQDLVIETGIPVEPVAPRQPVRRPAAGPQVPLNSTPAPVVVPPGPGPAANAPARGSLEQLRDFGRAPAERRPASLRHTGLMRPVSRMEPNLAPAQNSGQHADDSARSQDHAGAVPGGETHDQASDSTTSANRNGWSAEGNTP